MAELSTQERRVAEALARGATNKAIARELNISIKTVEFHLHNVYLKLGVTSRVQVAAAIRPPAARPSGTVTFLFTDIEGSSGLWERTPRVMAEVVARHDELVRNAIEAHEGYIFATRGDGFSASFWMVDDALEAAGDVQRAIASERWPQFDLVVRIGLNTGSAEERGGDYFGPAVQRTARITEVTPGRQVVVAATTAGLSADPSRFVDLGAHRLDGFERSEHLLRLCVPDVPIDDRPLRRATAPIGNLPGARSALIGRAGDLAVLQALLRHHRLVTVVGPGGVGKTRVALAAATAASSQFPDGAWLVELAEVGHDRDVLAAVAVTLSVELRASTTPRALATALGVQRRLIVIDNCEHLPLGVHDVVTAIVESCPNVTVLATSRQPLGGEGEQVLALPPLALTARAGRSDAATLFCDRAAGALGRFEPEDEELGVVETIVHRLDGLPLAIELAASRLVIRTLDELDEALADPLGVLTEPGTARQEGLASTIAWSYDLLDPELQVLFDRMSVFDGEVELSMAAAVVGGPPIDCSVESGLGILADQSLLTVRRSPGGTRYGMLETLRTFANHQLEQRGEADAVRCRFLDHMVDWTERAHRGVCSADELRWHRAIVGNWHHIRSAVDLACRRDAGDAGSRLITALLYWATTRMSIEVGTWSEAVLALPSAADHPLRSVVAISCSNAAHVRLDTVTRDERSALAFSEEERLGRAHEPLVPLVAGASEPDTPRARALAQEVQARSDAIGSSFWHHTGLMQTLLIDGSARPGTAARNQLVDRARQAVATAEQIGAPNHIAFSSLALGLALRGQEPEAAVPVLQRAHELATAVGNQLAEYLIRAHLAEALISTGRYLETVELLAGPLQRSYLAGAMSEAWLTGIPLSSALARLGWPDLAGMVLEATSADPDTRQLFDLDTLEAELREQLGPAELGRLKASPLRQQPDELVALVLAACDAALA